MTQQELIDACLPCKFCERKCFAEIHPLVGIGVEAGERLADGSERHYYDDPIDGELRWPNAKRLVRIYVWCDASNALHGQTGDKDDWRTGMLPPVEAIAEWNERFGKQ